MTSATTTSSRRHHTRRDEAPGTAESLVREAHTLLEVCGLHRSPAWVSRTVRAFLRSSVDGMPFGVYLVARVELNAQQRRALAEREDLRYVLSYADPTGETAIRNVARERAR